MKKEGPRSAGKHTSRRRRWQGACETERLQLESQRATLEIKLKSRLLQLEDAQREVPTIEELQMVAQNFDAIWSSADIEDKKLLVRALLDRLKSETRFTFPLGIGCHNVPQETRGPRSFAVKMEGRSR